MKLLTILLITFGILSCKGNPKEEAGANNTEDYETFVKGFYSWYLKEIYSVYKMDYFMPGYTKLSESSYIFNIQPVCYKLRSVGYFSDNYIKNDSLSIARCNNAMLKFEWDYEPEPEFNIEPCNFLWKDRITGGQGENLNSLKIIESTMKEENISIVNVDIYEMDKRVYNAKVEVVKQSSGFKVNSIILEWVRYK